MSTKVALPFRQRIKIPRDPSRLKPFLRTLETFLNTMQDDMNNLKTGVNIINKSGANALFGTDKPEIVAPDNVAAVGTDADMVREDHVHAAAVGSPVSIGSSNQVGTANAFSRADHVHALGTAGDVDYLRRDGGNSVTAEMDWDGFTIKDFGGCTSSKAALLTMTGDVADGQNVVAMKLRWNVLTDLPDGTFANAASIRDWVWTKADASERIAARLYPNYRDGAFSDTGPAFLLEHNLDLGAAGGGGHIGFLHRDASNFDNFSGMKMQNNVASLQFFLNNVLATAVVASGIQLGSSTTVTILDTTGGKDLRINPRGTNAANGALCEFRRRNTAVLASGMRLMKWSENVTGPGFVERFNIWSDNTFGQGGIGIPEDQFLSLDDLGSVRGNTGFRYNSATSDVDFFLDGALIWVATPAGEVEAPAILGEVVEMTGISAPANPPSGARRMFTDIVTGELSVRTSSGDTLSLEEGADVPLAVQLDEAAGSITYIGEAQPGTVTSAASWRVKRMDESGDPEIIILWADGDNSFDNIWDNRASLSYS